MTPSDRGWNSRAHKADMPLFGFVEQSVPGPKVRWRRTFA